MTERKPDMPPGPPRGTSAAPPRALTAVPMAPEGVDEEDEVTWVAGGNPFPIPRDNTLEASHVEDHERTQSADRAGGPSHAEGYEDDDPLVSTPTRPGATAAHATPELGVPAPDAAFHLEPRARPPTAERSGSAAARRERSATPVPGRSPDGLRAIPPPRRVATPVEASGTYRAPAPRATPLPVATTNRLAIVVGIVVPLLVGGLAIVGFSALVVSRFLPTSEEVEVSGPLLPVVGGPAPLREPDPPFGVGAPAPFRPDLGESGLDAAALLGQALEARAANNLVLAAALWDRAVRLEGRPSRFFENARLLADVGEVDAAFYWLVRAIREHGVPAAWLVEDRAFRRLWGDARWEPFSRWVVDTSRFFAARGSPMQHIALPRPLDAALAAAESRSRRRAAEVAPPAPPAADATPAAPTPPAGEPAASPPAAKVSSEPAPRVPAETAAAPGLPVLLWLDDVGGSGAAVPLWGDAIASRHGVVVIGVAGPDRIGPNGAMWSGDADRDQRHLAAALEALPGIPIDRDRIYLAGIGQGAQFAAEMILRSPTFAKAALVLSPTDRWKGARDPIGEGASHVGQRVILMAGAHEPAIHSMARHDRGRLMRAGIDAEMVFAPEPWPDGLPADFPNLLSEWLGKQLGPSGLVPVAQADPNNTPIGETPPTPPSAAPVRP